VGGGTGLPIGEKKFGVGPDILRRVEDENKEFWEIGARGRGP